MTIKQKFKQHLSKTPLWMILTVLMFVIFLTVSIFMTLQLYLREIRIAVQTEQESLQELSELRLVNINTYFDEMAQFSIRPVYDTNIYQLLIGTSPLDEASARSLASDFVYYSYYSRNDILSYQLSFLEQGFSASRSSSDQRVIITAADAEALADNDFFLQCENSSRNYTVLPAEGSDTDILYYHTLVRVYDGKSVGLVAMRLRPNFGVVSTPPSQNSSDKSKGTSVTDEFSFSDNTSDTDDLASKRSSTAALSIFNSPAVPTSSQESGTPRYFCICNANGDIFYSTLPAAVADGTLKAFVNTRLVSGSFVHQNMDGDALPASFSVKSTTSESSGLVEMDGTTYSFAQAQLGSYGLSLYSFSDYDSFIQAQYKSLRLVLVQGILFCLLLFGITVLLLRYLTNPLRILSRRLLSFGAGNFDHIDIQGSLEITELSDSYNKMADSIQQLIEQNYTAKLEEQKAMLTALEAQVNPHFLYNSLQAIGSEALLADDMAAYHMLGDLADCLRYSLRKGSTVPLQQELNYVDTYFRLQKLRKQDHIFLEKKIDPSTASLVVPKISLQSLVENAIEHGLAGDVTTIHIQIETAATDDGLILIVYDDGCGMASEEVERLSALCHKGTLTDEHMGIGIPNLYNRLQILYKGADILIESQTGKHHGTKITLLIPRE